MKKMKKKILMGLSLVAVAAISVNTTVAWLGMETETLVNTMEAGNVKIKQLEYERVVDENGNWISTEETDKYGYTPDELQEFTQSKMLVPAVFTDGKIKWDDRNGSSAEDGTGHQQSWGQIGASGSNQLFDNSVKNVIDKFVFVENTGKNNAYVRTWFAFEQGSIAYEDYNKIIETNIDANHWEWDLTEKDQLIGIPNVEIEDENGVKNTYIVYEAVYVGRSSGPKGVLAPGKVSYPSLLQVYMKPEATNEDVKALDGNKDGKFDILVVSQAVQVDGFDDAETALNAAFGSEHPFE